MKRERGIQISTKERQSLRKLLENGAPGATALRAIVILLSGLEMGSAQIATALRISDREVRKCRSRWRDSGIRGLRDAPRQGRPAEADPEYIRLLIRTAKKDPRKLGYVFARWTTPRLATYMAQKTGIKLSADYIGKILRDHNLTWGRGKLTTANLADPLEKKIRREMAKLAAEGIQITRIQF
jgi:transposase